MVLEPVQSVNRQREAQRSRAARECASADPSTCCRVCCLAIGTAETVVGDSLATFSASVFSAGGVAGSWPLVFPQRQLIPQLQVDSCPHRDLPQHRCAAVARQQAPQQAPLGARSAEQGQALDRPVSLEAFPPPQPHDTAGSCSGTAMAASQIRVRAAMPLVIHMSSNPCRPPRFAGGKTSFVSIGQ